MHTFISGPPPAMNHKHLIHRAAPLFAVLTLAGCFSTVMPPTTVIPALPEPFHRRSPGSMADVVVRLSGVSPASFARRHGLTLVRVFESDPFTAVVRGHADATALRRDPAVVWAEPDSPSLAVPMTPRP